MPRKLSSLGLWMCLFMQPCAEGQAKLALRFADYASSEFFGGKPQKIVWLSDFKRTDPHHEQLGSSVELTLPPNSNFAGHYAIVEYSCVSNYRSMAIIDMQTGAVCEGVPFDALEVNLDSKDDAIYKSPLFEKKRSRLLVASGCFYFGNPEKPHECGTKYFEFKNDRFDLLKFNAGPIPRWI
jgi:hypothetical protein